MLCERIKCIKRILLIVFTVAIISLCFTFSASALETSGPCGNNVYWNYDIAKSELVISGSGNVDGASAIRESRWQNYNIKNVVIKEGITGICEWAFYHCDSIETIELPTTLKFIGEKAFYFCSSLKEVYIGETVTDIYDFAFQDCHNAEIYYTYGVNSFIDNCDPFSGCNSIHLTIAASVDSVKNDEFDFLLDVNSLVVSEGVKNIEHRAFANSKITKVVLPKSLESIMESAFYNCKNLKEVTFLNPKTIIREPLSHETGFNNCLIRGYNNSTAYYFANSKNYFLKKFLMSAYMKIVKK